MFHTIVQRLFKETARNIIFNLQIIIIAVSKSGTIYRFTVDEAIAKSSTPSILSTVTYVTLWSVLWPSTRILYQNKVGFSQ